MMFTGHHAISHLGAELTPNQNSTIVAAPPRENFQRGGILGFDYCIEAI